MPKVPVIPSVGLDVVNQPTYSAPSAVPMQDQTPAMLGRLGQAGMQAGQDWFRAQRISDAQEERAADRAEAEAYKAERLRERAAKQAEETQRRADIAQVEETLAASGEEDDNELGKFTSLKGKFASEGFQTYREGLAKRHKKILDGAKNDQQRAFLKEGLLKRQEQLAGRAIVHRDTQTAVWRLATASTTRDRAMDSAARASLDAPGKVDELLGEALNATRDFGRLNGWDDNQMAAAMDQTEGQVRLRSANILLEAGRTGEAMAVLKQHGSKIDPDALAKATKQGRAQEIGDIARMLDQSVDTLEQRLAAIDEAEEKGLPREEADLGRRHLFSLENQRDARNAEIAADVELEARRWQATSGLPIEANPDLAERVATYGVTLKRVTNQRKLDAFYAAPPAELDRLRSLTPAQLHRELASYLDAHDEGMVTKFLRGDEGGARIDDLTTILARQLAILPGNDSAEKATPEQNRRFELWKATTIAPILKAERDRLKRDLTPDEFQKLVVNPILADKVWSESWGKDEAKPLMQLQQQGEAPVDDPLTPQDESQNFEAYSNLYVKVEGQEVRLRDIPMEARKAIRDDWAKNNPGQWLSAAEEAAEWLLMKAKYDKANPPKQPKPVVYPVNDFGGINPFAPTPPTRPQ